MLESHQQKLDPRLLEGLNEVKVNPNNVSHLTAEDLEDDKNEFYILQCPDNVDVAKLLTDQKICLDGVYPITSENSSIQYESVGRVDKDSSKSSSNINQVESLVTLLPDSEGQLKLVTAPVKGHILIRKSIEVTPLPTLVAEPKPHHQIPLEKVRHRHPIYGVPEVRTPGQTKAKGSKRKKDHSSREVVAEEQQQKYETSEEDVIIEVTPRRKKKKPEIEIKLE